MPSSKRDTDSPRGGASQSDASFRRGGPTEKGTAAPGRAGRRELDLETPRVGTTTPQLGRKRLASAAQDPGEWSGASEGDTFADTDLHAGAPPGEDEFVDEDTFTDRDADASEIASRDTMRELLGRDTLLDLTATALALSGEPTFDDTDAFSGDRTLDDEGSFPDEDTFDEPTSEKRGR